MHRGAKKEVCRNFASGSCRYGDRCRFLHSKTNNIQQHPTTTTTTTSNNNNPFGFGAFAAPQQQQQQPNNKVGAFASFPKQQNQFKNTWTRTPDTNNPTLSANQPPTITKHDCTNPQLCKRQMHEDFQKESPLWKLTCYAHFMHLPCDITGDISYEELRAAAYDDAKKGLTLPSVVERERNMVKSKLIEFENLLHNPSLSSRNTVTDRPSPFQGISASQTTLQNNVPPSVSSFSQLGISNDKGSNTSGVAPTNYGFGQQSSFLSPSQTAGSFGTNNLAVTPSNSISGQQNPFPVPGQTFGSFGTNNLNLGTQGSQAGLFKSQQHMQPQGNVSTSSSPSLFLNNQTPFSTNLMQSTNFANNQSPGSGGQAYVEKGQEGVNGDMSIWLKEKWNPGEIPEEAPPEKLCT